MCHYVLFSPIGRSDPVRNDFDGPFLHILRHYPVKKAVLYLTKETFALHRQDDRYLALACRVSPNTECEVCGDDTLEQAQTFEIYDAPFRAAIEKLHSENPECEVLVNISSGTPQMEASLYLLKAILSFPVRAIQVTSPAKRSNESAHMGTAGPLDPDALYAALRDNDPAAENRCVEVGGENAQAALLRKNILALINSYDYTAALTLAESAPELFDGGFLAALRAAKQRAALEIRTASQVLSGCFEENRPGLMEGYEYILMLDTLVQREAWGDYARALSPALVELLVLALRQLVGLDIHSLCVHKTSGAEWHISPQMIDSRDPAMLAYLERGYRSGLRESPLNADVMLRILNYYREKKDWRKLDTRPFARLRKFEQTVRNCAAHQVTPITEQQIQEWTGGDMSIPQAQKLLKSCFAQTGGKAYRWNGYEIMNRQLTHWLETAR